MADYFISKTRVATADLVTADGQPVLERHADLSALLAERAGPETAALFAEPLVSHGNDEAPPSVSWYTTLPGEAVPLERLTPAERSRAERWLSDHLRPMRAMAEDPGSANLVWGALTTLGQSDIQVVGDRPVITNWGLMLDGNGANASTRTDHFARTLGSYVSTPAQPVAAAPPAMPASAAAPTTEEATEVAPPVTPARRGVPAIAWVPLVILLALAGATLYWLLQPGTRLFPPETPLISEAEALEAQTALNDSLRARKAELDAALEGAVCRADGVLIVPGGLTPEGLTPPKEGTEFPRKAAVAPGTLLPNAADRVLVPGDGEEDQTLLGLLEASTVLVLARGPAGMSAGSGFVVGPGLIVTNQHLIADAAPGEIAVAGKGLEQPLAAQVLKAAGPLEETGQDFALLQIEGADLPAFPIHLTEASLKLTNVIAAGYPGDVLELDIDFAALKAGDLSAVPDLTVTDGIVNTEQQIGPQTSVLMHSAALSSGNSGGPLVDMCGRVVGVNTFVRKGPLQNRGFALSSGDLLAFLEGTEATPAVVTETCAPEVRPHVPRAKDSKDKD